MEKWTLITGASKGIGLDMAESYAKEGHNLILVARSIDLLKKAADNFISNYKIKIEIIAQDLSIPESAGLVKKILLEKHIKVHTLINNAGIGIAGEFQEQNIDTIEKMSNLNMLTLTKLCHIFISDMKELGGGEILNVASTAAFQPGPFFSVYYASKAYVLHFSEGLHQELKKFNIKVSCLCPGPTQTNFFIDNKLETVHLSTLPWMKTSASVAKIGHQGMKSNKAIVIPGIINWLMAISVRFTPRFITRIIVGKLNSNI